MNTIRSKELQNFDRFRDIQYPKSEPYSPSSFDSFFGVEYQNPLKWQGTANEAPRAPARRICGKAKRNSAEATRLRPMGYAPVACRQNHPRASTRGLLAKASDPMHP